MYMEDWATRCSGEDRIGVRERKVQEHFQGFCLISKKESESSGWIGRRKVRSMGIDLVALTSIRILLETWSREFYM